MPFPPPLLPLPCPAACPVVDRRASFTLIELLIVVSIIAVLAAMLLPAMGKARHSARLTICMTQQRQLAQAVFLYADDNSDELPHNPAHFRPCSGQPYSAPIWYTWQSTCVAAPRISVGQQVRPYLRDARVAYCPLAPGVPQGAATNFTGGTTDMVAGAAPMWRFNAFSNVKFEAPERLGDNRDALLMVDTAFYSTASAMVFSSHPSPRMAGTVRLDATFAHYGNVVISPSMILNATYVDGHAESVRVADMERGYYSSISATGYTLIPKER